MRVSSHFVIDSSPTLAINARALEKKKQGIRVYNLSVGEALVDVDPRVAGAVERAIHEGKTHYAPASGIFELRNATAEWMNHSYHGNYSAEETLVACGGKHGVYLALQSLMAPGDEVIIIAPYWTSYPSIVRLLGGVPRIVEANVENSWKVEIGQLSEAVNRKTRVLIFNNGTNPTGALYSADEVREMLEFAAQHQLAVISDEVYSGLTYDGSEYISCAQFPEFRDTVCVVQSCSKNFALAGLRVGFVYGHSDFIATLSALQGQSTSGTSVISQYAALAAVQNADSIISNIRKEIEKRRDVFVDNFEKLFNTEITKPQASLYYFLPLTLFKTDLRSGEWCERVLEEAHVALVPGSAFGADNFVRCSFGAREEDIRDGLAALAEWVEKNGEMG